MVIGKDFVWAHLAKAAGNSTLLMFLEINNLLIYSDPIDSHSKHLSFMDKENELDISMEGKKRLLNIRRLPAWILSYVYFQKRNYSVPINDKFIEGYVFSADPNTVKNGIPTYNEMHVDDVLKHYEYKSIDYWLRTESLAEDFIEVMTNFGPINKNKQSKISRIRDNVNLSYNRRISDNFSAAELDILYEACPIWRNVEENVYGDILSLNFD